MGESVRKQYTPGRRGISSDYLPACGSKELMAAHVASNYPKTHFLFTSDRKHLIFSYLEPIPILEQLVAQ